MLTQLQQLQITPTACLVEPPPELKRKLDAGSPELAPGHEWGRLINADRSLWQPQLAFLISRHADHLESWQLGTDGSNVFVTDPEMRNVYKAVYREFANLMEKPDLAMPWPAWCQRDGEMPAQDRAACEAGNPPLAVAAVTCSGYLPMAGMAFPPTEARIVGRPELGEIQLIGNGVSPEYFPTLGVPILAGRGFAGMHPGDPPVAIISENAARRYFGSANPLGQHLDMDKNGKWEIVGVVGDVRDWGRRQGTKPQFYYPFWQPPTFTSSLFELVRLANTPPPGLEAMIRRAAYAADSHLIVNVQHLADNARQDVQNERNAMLIMEVMSALALVLAATGLFAVMAYGVAQRQREFGVRMALGAAPRDLQRLVLRRGLLLAAAGVVIGLGAAWSLTRFLQSVLYETSVHDPITYTGVAVALLGVALLACWLPAKRAARADPMEVLRAE